MRQSLYVLLTAVGFALAAHATAAWAEDDDTKAERLRDEMAWTSLQGQMGTLSTQHGVLSTLLQQYSLCHGKLRFYAPGSTNPTKDADGCVSPPVPTEIEVVEQTYTTASLRCNTPTTSCGNDSATGCGCKNDDATARQVCKILGHRGFISYDRDRFPNDSTKKIVTWDAASSTFVAVNVSKNYREYIKTLTCYSLTRP